MNKINAYETSLNICGVAYSLANLQTIIGIIVGVLTLISILYRFAMTVYEHIKNKQYDKISTDIEQTKNELVDFNKKIEKEKGENNNGN